MVDFPEMSANEATGFFNALGPEEQKREHRFVSLNLKNCGFYGIRPKWANDVRPYPVPEGKSDKDEILPMKKI